MSDHNLMCHIINSLPEKKNHILGNQEIRLIKDSSNPARLTWDNASKRVSDWYIYIIDKEGHQSERDVGLSRKFKKQFKGICRYCGMYERKGV